VPSVPILDPTPIAGDPGPNNHNSDQCMEEPAMQQSIATRNYGFDDPDGDVFLSDTNEAQYQLEEAGQHHGSSQGEGPDPEVQDVSDQGLDGEAAPQSPRLRKRSAKELYSQASKKLKEAKAEVKAAWSDHAQTVSRTNLQAQPLLREGDEDVIVAHPWDTIHQSHTRYQLGDLVFCNRCGYWSIDRLQKLNEECRGKPPHNDQKAKLKRMCAGLHPDRKVTHWRNGADARTPLKPQPLPFITALG
jgi:hypothetical protein